MNNGGVENVKENGSSKKTNHKKLGCRSDEFVNGVVKVAVAQICESIGFQGFQSSALASLSDIAVRYVRDIGKCATSSANLAGRNQCNVFDVLHGLEDLSSNQGFSSGSSVDRCLLASGAVKEVVRFVGTTEEIPFAYAVPEFPVVRKRKLENSFFEKGEDPPEGHIPNWLPVLPDTENYDEKQSECNNEVDVKVKLKDVVHEVDSMKRPILSLQHRWACNGSEAMLANEMGDGTRVKRVAESNPFLAPPLPSEEKEVSQVLLPMKLLEESEVRSQNGNPLSALEEFALVVEAFESRPSQSLEEVGSVASNRNPPIRLTLRSNNKYSYKASKIRNENTEKLSCWFNSDSEEDGMKTRMEIMDGIENQHDIKDGVENHQETINGIENHREIVNGIEKHQEMKDGIENHQETINGIENQQEMKDGIGNHQETINGIENQLEMKDGIGNHQETINGIENQQEMKDGIGNHQETMNGIENHQEMKDGIGDHQEIMNGVRSQQEMRDEIEKQHEMMDELKNQMDLG